jgi:pyruvate/2-oxoglutarate dehydrogenase complex dihydrolipoamide acyltransferase (E2) component
LELSSYGGKKAFAQLIEAIKQQAVKSPAYLFPLISLSSESYRNKKHGTTIFNPIFEVVGWCNEAGNQQGEAAQALAAPEPAPAAAPAPAPAAEPAPEPAAAPARRRRVV